MKRILQAFLSIFLTVCSVTTAFLPVAAEEPGTQTVTLVVETYYNDELYSGTEFPVEVKNTDTGEIIGRADEIKNGRAYIELIVSTDENTPISVSQVKGENPEITYDESTFEKVVTKDGRIVNPSEVPEDEENNKQPGQSDTDTEKQARIAEAQQAVADKEAVYNQAKVDYDAALKAVTDLEAQQGEVSASELNAYGFFSAQEDQTAYQILTGTYTGNLLKAGAPVSYQTILQYTEDKEGSATSLANIRNALDLIDEVNAKREAENAEEHAYRTGLKPFKVTDSLMAVAILVANYNEYCEFNHPQTFNTAENIATAGKGYAVDAWYWERDIFWADPEQGEQMKTMSAWNLYTSYPDVYFNVGHYLNIVADTYPYIGLAVAGDNGMTSMDIYWYTCGSEGAYTTDEYRARLDAFEASAGNAEESDELKQARAVLAEAENALNTATESYNTAINALNALLAE